MSRKQTDQLQAVEDGPDYFLRAKLIIPAAKRDEYLAAAARILPRFEAGTDFQLEVASIVENEKDGTLEVFHLWDIPDPGQVVKAMTFLGDFPAYLALDQLVTYADQDLVIALPRLGVVVQRGYSEDEESHEMRVAERRAICSRGVSYPVVRIVDTFKKNKLDEILALYEENLPDIERDSRARLVGGFLNITGDLNQIHWIWKLKATDGGKPFFNVAQLPDRKLVQKSADDIMEPAPYQHGRTEGSPLAAAAGGDLLDYPTTRVRR